jgi:hypothetical protein
MHAERFHAFLLQRQCQSEPAAIGLHVTHRPTIVHLCVLRVVLVTCRYDLRTENLTECQVDWYALDADTSLNYQQLTAQQAALPCTLWSDNSTNTYG